MIVAEKQENKQIEQIRLYKDLLDFVSSAIDEHEDVISGRIGNFQAFKLAALNTVASSWLCPSLCEQASYILSLENKEHWNNIYDKLISAEFNLRNYIAN